MTDYSLLTRQLASLSEGVRYPVSILSNASALLYETLPDLNWAGFYLLEDGKLILGPFQGRTACVEIEMGKGVCGTAAAREETVLVPDVHAFPGHIACDSASESEIVVPMMIHGTLYGVLDIDSPKKGRFTEEDQVGLEHFVQELERILESAPEVR